mgnify:CR=1 FL=1
MIYIVHKALTSADKQAFLKILSYAKIKEDDLKFMDISCEDLDLDGKNFVFALNTYKEVAKSYVASGVFEMRQVLGSDIYDEDSSFALVNIPYTIQDLFTNTIAKQSVWQKINVFYDFYQKMISKVSSGTIDNGAPFNDDVSCIGTNKDGMEAEDTPLTVETSELLAKLAENLDFSDPALGKSLLSSDKIEFETENLKVHVYPNNRIPKKDSMDNTLRLSFKDMLAILKMISVFDAKKISFFKSKE